MSRVKTQEELDQEARDEALARQMQMEADSDVASAQQRASEPQPSSSSSSYPGQQHRGAAGGGGGGGSNSAPMFQSAGGLSFPMTSALPQLSMPHVRCTKCSAINTLQPAKMHLQQICGQCQKLLPPHHPPGGQPQHRAASGGPQPASTANSAPSFHAPAPQQQQGGGGNSGSGGGDAPVVLQGQVQPPQQIQARCGQCQAINALPVENRMPGESISFKCGQCQSINKVTL